MGYRAELEAKRCKLPFGDNAGLPDAPDPDAVLVGTGYYPCSCGKKVGAEWVGEKWVPVRHDRPETLPKPTRNGPNTKATSIVLPMASQELAVQGANLFSAAIRSCSTNRTDPE
jgi:hypothetical protein